MPKLVQPKVFLTGYTAIDMPGVRDYLAYSGNSSFLLDIEEAMQQGLSGGEILCSLYAKLCYASLTLGKNENVTRIRSIQDNLLNVLDSAHGSVIEHCSINFVATDCSRVYTHELVRHRVGTAFSQTSGRYVRGDEIKFVLDPILEPVKSLGLKLLMTTEEVYAQMCDRMGLNGTDGYARHMVLTGIPYTNEGDVILAALGTIGLDLSKPLNFDYKKKVTSALRRFLPNGQANEIGFTMNLRTLRQTIMARTSRHAEWEIRDVFGQVYRIVKEKWPLMFSDAKEETVEDLVEVTGMKLLPF
jgi:thymidylate synthase (FAD)